MNRDAVSLVFASTKTSGETEMALVGKRVTARSGHRVIWQYGRLCVSLPLLAVLAGCTATAWSEKMSIDTTPVPTECGGWQKIELKQRTSLLLMREDPRLMVDVDAHNLKGRNLGCWQ